MKSSINTKLNAFSAVFKKPKSVFLAIIVSWLTFTTAVWLPNTTLILTVLGSNASLFDKIIFLGTLYRSIVTNFTLVSATYTLLIAFLFGLQMVLLQQYIMENSNGRTSMRRISGAGIGGLIAGFFGIGCAACGTFILTSVLSLIGAGGILTFLPFGGQEFGFLGVGLLLYSIWLLLKKLTTPATCQII